MSFKERSSWITALAIVVVCGWHLAALWRTGGALPILPVLIAYIVCLTLLSVAGHTAVTIASHRDAGAADDERDLQIAARADSIGGIILAVSLSCALGWYLVQRAGDVLFQLVLASLALGQLAASVSRIVRYRRGA